MAIKNIEYSVNLNGITPSYEQFGGTQGDHRVGKIVFMISDELYELLNNTQTDVRIMYRFDVYDGEGGLWQSEPTELATDSVSIELEEKHTRFGGKITVYLVITALSVEDETEIELYSFPARLRLNNRPDGIIQQGESYESVTALAEVVKTKADEAVTAAQTAEKENRELQEFVSEIEEKLENGEFDGADGISVTHSWDGTVLTVTSASGTSSADLKGEKGDTDAENKVDKIPSKQRETLDGKNGQIGVYATNDYSDGNPFLAQLHYNWEPYTIPYRLASGQIHVGMSGYDEINKESKIFQDSAVPKSYLAMVRTILENSIQANYDEHDNLFGRLQTVYTMGASAISAANSAQSSANTALSSAKAAQAEADSKKVTSSYTSAKTVLDFNSVYILWSNSGNVDIELYNSATGTRVADTAGETLATAKVCVLFLPESSTEITSGGVSKSVSKRCLYFGITGTPSILNTNVVSKQFVVNSGNLYFTPATAVSVFKIAL